MRPAESGWKARRAGTTQFFQAVALRNLPWLVHGFSTRVSLEEWDTPAAIAANRARLVVAMGAPRMALITVCHVHSDAAHVISAPGAFHPADSPAAVADAVMTQQAGLLLSVQTADCVPILLADTRRRVAAAVHAGWRGTLARIAAKTLGRMRQEFGTHPRDVVAAIGPAIGRCCYQVGSEVAQAFASQFPAAAEWFDGPFARLASGEDQDWLPWLTMMPPGHLPEAERVYLDLRAANRRQLADAGVPLKRIATSTLCTRCRAGLFFSYRREGAGTGRLLAVIGIREGLAKRRAPRAEKRPAKSQARSRPQRAIR